MQGLIRRTWLALCVAAALGCDLSPPIDVEQAVLVPPASATNGKALASNAHTLYFTLHNRGNADVVVSGVTVDSASGAQLQSVTAHRMPGQSGANGMPGLMQSIDRVDVPRHSRVAFAPGGYTVSVLPGARVWRAGDSVAFTVQLASAWTVSGRARVVTFAEHDAASASGAESLDTSGASSAPADSASAVARGSGCIARTGVRSATGSMEAATAPLAKVLQPPPRNFRAALPFANGGTADAIARTLATGLPVGGSMPLYPHLSRPERLAIASYVLSLGTRNLTSDTGSSPRSKP